MKFKSKISHTFYDFFTSCISSVGKTETERNININELDTEDEQRSHRLFTTRENGTGKNQN